MLRKYHQPPKREYITYKVIEQSNITVWEKEEWTKANDKRFKWMKCLRLQVHRGLQAWSRREIVPAVVWSLHRRYRLWRSNGHPRQPDCLWRPFLRIPEPHQREHPRTDPKGHFQVNTSCWWSGPCGTLFCHLYLSRLTGGEALSAGLPLCWHDCDRFVSVTFFKRNIKRKLVCERD